MIKSLEIVFVDLESTASAFNETAFFNKPDNGKWSVAENLQHLFLTLNPLVDLLSLPEIMLERWGSSNRVSRDYDDIVAVYLRLIGRVGTTTSRYVPKNICVSKAEEIQNYHKVCQSLLEKISTLSESELDSYQLPHPIIGLLTLKEFLHFTKYHHEVHLETLKKLLA